MTDPKILKIFPATQMKPYDGMAVTAAVWAHAHGEHRQALRAHNRIFHGSGIVTGLEVVANDPPNRFVFVSPGVAIDPLGQVIVLSETVAYDFGDTSEGTFFLLLEHGEHEVGGVEKEVRILQDEFVIAARPQMTRRPAVELARLNITDAGDPVKNAASPHHPHNGELDLRFRETLTPPARQLVRVALCRLGSWVPAVVTGWEYLRRECARSTPYALVVDSRVRFSKELPEYDLVYLSGKGAFKPRANYLNALCAVLDAGRMLIAESLDAEAEQSFCALFDRLGVRLSPLEPSHPILTSTFLFHAPPPGPLGSQIQLDGQLIFSTAGYSLAWGGDFDSRPASRADIRSAHEWGINLLHYCIQHMAS
jgi:hypothetical protein